VTLLLLSIFIIFGRRVFFTGLCENEPSKWCAPSLISLVLKRSPILGETVNLLGLDVDTNEKLLNSSSSNAFGDVFLGSGSVVLLDNEAKVVLL